MRGNRGAGLGIPPPEKFRSGFFPRGVVPVTSDVAIDDSGSDMDESSGTEVYVYWGRYSLDSSPRDEAPRPKALAGGGGGSSRYAQNQYSSDTYSKFSISRENAWQQVKQGGVNGYVEEEGEWSDSAGSTGNTQQSGRVGEREWRCWGAGELYPGEIFAPPEKYSR